MMMTTLGSSNCPCPCAFPDLDLHCKLFIACCGCSCIWQLGSPLLVSSEVAAAGCLVCLLLGGRCSAWRLSMGLRPDDRACGGFVGFSCLGWAPDLQVVPSEVDLRVLPCLGLCSRAFDVATRLSSFTPQLEDNAGCFFVFAHSDAAAVWLPIGARWKRVCIPWWCAASPG
ncbi:hypothetical protein Ancab_022166 [Ancistrocladus abbreviatus]